MKKYFLSLILVLVSVVAVMAATSFGIGNPYSVTPAASGDIYKNMSTGTLWKANSTTKGDWTQLTPVISDGSADAPFVEMNATKLIVGIDSLSIAGASGAATLDASVLNVTTSATGDILTVDDGDEGQILTVIYKAQGHATDSLVITPDNLASGTSVTLANLSERAVMLFNGTEWYVIYTNGTVN